MGYKNGQTFISVFVSIQIHIGLALLIYFLMPSPPLTPVTQNPIEVTLFEKFKPISQSKKPEKMVVRDLEVPDKVKKDIQNDNEPALFSSSKTQRVTEQTRALSIGPNRNSLAPRPLQIHLSNSKKTGKREVFEKADLGDRFIDLPAPSLAIESTVGTLLPSEIKIGSFTALNTDKFTYYSFFERIEDKLRYRWEIEVREALRQIPPYELAQYPKNMAITHLEVILDRSGTVEKILLTRSSGLAKVDEAPAKAFWNAKNFMNPPQGLVEEDGKVHLRYQFLVYLK